MLNEFKATLQRYIKRECELPQVIEHLNQLLKKHPQLAEPIESQIDQLTMESKLSIDAKMAIFEVTSRFKSDENADQTVISTDQTAPTDLHSMNETTQISAPTELDDDTEIISGEEPTDLDDKTAIESDENDSTQISTEIPAQTPNDDDSTQISTEVPGGTTQTGVTQADDGFGLDLDMTGGNSGTAPTVGPDGMPVMTHGDEIIDVGSVLRNRFELKTKLGEGGMGAVFMAIDKIKEEAQDKNCKVAVKVLNETFKQFRESFIALQRESSKQQRLAHPNIATVFDFDRDYTYGTVFMTMEFMEGEPLDVFIRRVPPEGLSYEEAQPIIDGMCHGLAYAHHHQLVHSDFKPANTFLNKDGVVKLLDFGIARAAKPKDAGADSEKETTLFDPGTLGALTPAYASAEMLEGETPEPPDDIYALACVTYQLLGGKHPFNKMPANQARDNKLSPAPIKKLKRRQMKGLVRGLAFKREDRTQTVEEFLDEITPKKPILLYSLIGAAIILGIIGVLARGAIEAHFLEQRNQKMIATITEVAANRQAAAVSQNLQTLQTFDEDSQARIKAESSVQNAIVGYFSRRIDQQVDKEQKRYNYPQAYVILHEARKYYPDSGKLDSKQDELDQRKQEELQAQRDLYTRFLKTGPWLEAEGDDNDIPDVVKIIGEVDPGNTLLTDPRLVGSYITEARGSQQDSEFERAKQLLLQARTYTDNLIDIINAEDELAYAQHQAKELNKLNGMLQVITSAAPEKGLANALAVREELAFMRLVAPEHELLIPISEALTKQLLKAASQTKELSKAETIFQSLAPILSDKQQTIVRNKLNTTWQKAGGVDPEITQNRQLSASELKTEIDTISGNDTFSHEWSQSLRQTALQIQALLGQKHVTTQQVKRDLAIQHMNFARTASDQGQLSQGSILISYAKQFDGQAPGLADAEELIAKQLREQENQRLETERQATIIALKHDILAKAKSEQVDDAIRFLDLLNVYLVPDDPFLTTEAPNAIGKAYANIALRDKQRFDNEKDYITKRDGYMAALETVNSGFKIAADSRDLRVARAEIQYALITANVRNTFNTSQVIDIENLQQKLNELQKYKPGSFERLQTEFSESVANRISTMETYDPVAAQQFLDASKQLPLNQVLLSRIRVAVVAPSKYAADLEKAIKGSNLSEASTIFSRAKTEESDHPDIKRLRAVLANRINEANKAYKGYQRALRNNNSDQAKPLIARAIKIWRDNPEFIAAFKAIKISIVASKAVCQTRLAGYGKRSRGRCYDMVSIKNQGPIMVVLPAGAGRETPFAISKYEISVADFNHYCEKTKQCQVNNANPKLPITNISLQQMNDYAAWLSKITGAKYRLPTATEWEHASNAGGSQPKGKTYNCTLRLGDKLIKGTGLEDVNSGKQNGWGLVNYIGNAQELVTTQGGTKARGGAYRDAMQECGIELERNHDGSSDEITSFRIVRDVI